MIELYILASLAAIGYAVNLSQKRPLVTPTQKVPKNAIPSMNTVYDSTYYKKSQDIHHRRAQAMYEKSQDPVKTRVISKNFAHEKDDHMKGKVKLLTGEYVNEREFTHKNMQPFFGGAVKQNMDPGINEKTLENYTGAVTDFKKKCEVNSFYDNTKNMGYVNGAPNTNDYVRERMLNSKVQNNTLPFDQVRVGPGLGQGSDPSPTGGFQQFDMQDFVRPKTVDELRVATNPKQTFEGRTVDGMKGKTHAEIEHFDKNRPDTFYEQSPDQYLRTTGAYIKPREQPAQEVKDTNRQDTTTEYVGVAVGSKARTSEPNVRAPLRNQLGEFGITNPALDKYGKGSQDDYGRAQMLVYANERDVTTTRVVQGNLTSLVKAIIAPIEDLLMPTKKDDFIDNPRHFGNMNPQVPEKPVAHDPNDVARTTIKETNIHEAVLANLKGHTKLTVHDPNDVARTTTKETNIHDSVKTNLKGHSKLTVYDPNDIARTTIKETLIHDDTGTGTITGPKQIYIYDPDEIAKTTIRETLDRMDYELNIHGPRKARVYDPDDTLRTTMKETIEDNERDGNIDRVEGMGDYKTTEYRAPNTHKQFTSDFEHYGGAARNKDQGYQTNEYSAKNTSKQFMSDNDYYGVAEASSDKKQMSMEDMYNAHISNTQESILYGREPTLSGTKAYITKECVNLSHRKQECQTQRALQNKEKVMNILDIPPTDDGITRMKKMYKADDRLDPSLLKAYLENPYTKPLFA